MLHQSLSVYLVINLLITNGQSGPNYRLIHERVEFLEYKHEAAADVEFYFGKYNRTHNGLTTSFQLLQDLTDRDLHLQVLIYKLFGTEFKKTGTKIQINLCKFLETNTFGFVEDMSQHSNIHDCNFTKKKYWIKDFAPSEKKFPPILPFGSYRCEIGIFHSKENLFRLNWFAKVEQLVKTSK